LQIRDARRAGVLVARCLAGMTTLGAPTHVGSEEIGDES
jgi:hypothetical protein